MPTISIFYGIVIKMYYREHNPPHFHAFYQGFEAVYDILKKEKINGEFPRKANKIVVEWAQEYSSELMSNWNLMEKGQQLKRIPGAE